jgi:hypothetical protein
MEKYCSDCRRWLPASAFTRNRRNKDGLAFYCAPCARARHLASRRARFGPPKTRNGQGPSDVPPGHKWCPECDEIKPVADFPRNRAQRNGLGTYCKQCHNRIVDENRAKLHGETRNYHLKHRYGITSDDFERMFTEQDGRCAICREAPAEHVDHDHATKRVRGLLCFNCNGAPGQFRDRRDLMLAAVAYLDANGLAAAGDRPLFEFGLFHGNSTSPRPSDEPAFA